MSDLLKWFPFTLQRWNPPFHTVLRSPWELLNSLERMFDTAPAPIRVEEYLDDKTLVVRADMPGVDSDKDVEITVEDGYLHIRAERQEKEEHKDKNNYRSEFHYGSFSRSIHLPEGVKEEDIKASYTDGILEVRMPAPEEASQPNTAKKLPISRG